MAALLSTPLLTRSIAQAGGGGAFGGGGGGDGGDGEGIGWLVYWLIRLVIEVPVIGVPVLIGAFVVFVIGIQRGWWKHQERTIRHARPHVTARHSAVAAEALRATDPGFDEARFLARVEQAFHIAQKSWCDQDLEPLRPFVSDGVFERFSLQIEEQQEDGWRQGMSDTRVGPLSIAHVEPGRHFDTVTVRIPFTSDIHRIERATQKRIPGSSLPRDHFAECWSFLRRRGAKTLTGAGLIEGKCPNCGAPLTMKQSARCSHCECLARSGQFDWVLAEITQASEWRVVPERTLPGLALLEGRDPGFNVQMLEDRASVAFWRKCAAERRAAIDPLTRVAAPSFVESYGAELAVLAGKSPRSYAADCAVGSVRVLGLVPGLGEQGRDRALVEIVWDARAATVTAQGVRAARSLAEQRVLRTTLFVFGRASGATTRLDEAFTTAHCPSCGAHDAGGTRPDCPWCGAPRAGDASTWLLEATLARHTPDARALEAELAHSPPPIPRVAPPPLPAQTPSGATPSSSGLLSWAAALVRADGHVSAKERRALAAMAERVAVSPERLAVLLDANLDAERDGHFIPTPADADEAYAWLEALTALALEDGVSSHAERKVLHHAARRLGVGRRDATHTLNATRSELYRDSRTALRENDG